MIFKRQPYQRVIASDGFGAFLITVTVFLWVAAAVLWALVLS